MSRLDRFEAAFGGEPMSDDLSEDLARVFDLLLAAGADVHYVDPKSGETSLVTFSGEAVGRFLLR